MKRFELGSQNVNGTIRQNINDYFRDKTPQDFCKDLIILVILIFCLAILVSPSLFSKRSEFRAGTIAVEDVKADRDFLVEEKLSTETKKSAILKITPAVFDYKSDLSLTLQSQIIQLFENLSSDINRSSNRKIKSSKNALNEKQVHVELVRNYFEKNLGVTMTDEEINVFYKYKFANTTARAICKLIDKSYFDTYIINQALNKIDYERGIIVRNTKSHEETLLTDFRNIIVVSDIKNDMDSRSGRTLTTHDSDFRWAASSLVKKIITPNLTLNISATDARKEAALKIIKPFYFQVMKNEMIVREGERITQSIQDKLDAYYTIKGGKSKITDITSFLGIVLVILLMGVALFPPVRKWNPKLHDLKSTLVFLVVVILFQFILIRFGLIISDAVSRAFPIVTAGDCFYAIPFVTGAMLVTVLINDRISIIFSVFVSLMLAFIFEARVIIPLFSLMGSFFSIYQISTARQRSAFFMTGLLLGVLNGISIFALSLLTKHTLDWTFLINLLMGFIGGIASGIIVSGILPLFESLFKFTTDIKLLELGNLNQTIFQRMIIETPGTYHHSIIVATLVESAAEAIGANALLAKVSAYYHDIGKMAKPQYFIENQQTGDNKHDKLSPKMSSLVIISHVKDGCDFAHQLKLGNPITNIIRQHHGTSLVSYFYDKAKKDPDSTFNTLSDSDFRYPGPKPQTKEAGLVLLGDVIEASSRTLADPTPSRINNLVHERIEKIFLDGQLDECELTLRDLNKIADSFIRILTGIFHHRISYPELITSKEGNGVKLG